MIAAYLQESDPIETTPVTGKDGQRSEVGMRISPEVVLFVGAVVLTVALIAVFTPFLVRIWRDDAVTRGNGASRDQQRAATEQHRGKSE
jgi:hypothetical protein